MQLPGGATDAPHHLPTQTGARRRVTRRARATPAGPKQTESNTTEETAWPVTESDVLSAISSLYDDGLRPYGRFIRKRLAEFNAVAVEGQGSLDPNLGRLRAACELSSSIIVEPADGGEWVALLVGRQPSFIDFYCTDDIYPGELWASLEVYFGTLEGDDALLPGGRYACARALLDLELPFLSNRSLGEMCHIVELGLTQKKLLGYLNGAITPYANSSSMAKDSAAQQHAGGSAHHFPFASWETTRSHLIEILESALKKGKQQVPLSTLKRLFRSRFRTELSETALGYTKISDLLQDARVNDICSVQLLESGYVVIPQSSLANSVVQQSRTRSKWSSAPRLVLCKDSDVRTIVQSFTHGNESLPSVLPNTPRRSQSQPRNVSSSRDAEALTHTAFGFDMRQSANVGLECVPELPEPEALSVPESVSAEESVPRLKLCLDRPLSFEGGGSVSARSGTLSARSGATSVRSRRSALPSPALTASPLYDWVPRGGESMSCVPETQSLEGPALHDTYFLDGTAKNFDQHQSNSSTVESRFTFAPEEFLCVDDTGVYGQLPVFAMQDWMPCCDDGVLTPSTRSKWAVSPSLLPTDECFRGIIENTIFAAEPLQTPRSARRSNSLPRDLGSERATVAVAWESEPVSPYDGPCYKLALPSPAVTASDWGTPRTPNIGLLELDQNPRQVLNLSEFL